MEYPDETVTERTFLDGVVIDNKRSKTGRGLIYLGVPLSYIKVIIKAAANDLGISKDTKTIVANSSEGYLWVSATTEKIINTCALEDGGGASPVPLARIIDAYKEYELFILACTTGIMRLKCEVKNDDDLEDAKNAPWNISYALENMIIFGEKKISTPDGGRERPEIRMDLAVRKKPRGEEHIIHPLFAFS